jgi:VanZ family protein
MYKPWVLWSLGLITFAAMLKLLDPILRNTQGSVILGWEPLHIVAHTFLYGTLSWLVMRHLKQLPWAVVVALTVGVLQEATQLAFGHRGPGLPEIFDLAVDGTAATLAVVLFPPRTLNASRSLKMFAKGR